MKTRIGTHTSRKIEQRMVEAALDCRTWRESNTQVVASTHEVHGMPVARIYLFEKHIANLVQVRHDEWQLQVMRDTLERWPTNTTISRLRALGAWVTCVKGEVFLDGKYIADHR